ncbi:MAG TPA: flagellar biosynthesis protein FlhF [Chondromyces sp.]|nr:flagellar biosynthesis protein FlhF [Chondromyces sp.]
MKVKKYTAPSMPEVMKKIREELGEHAVILQSKTVYSGGLLGLFKKKNIEVVAGIDDPNVSVPLPRGKKNVADTHSGTVLKEKSEKSFLRMTTPEWEMNEPKKKIELPSNKESMSTDSFPEEIKEVLLSLKRQGIEKAVLLSLAKNLLAHWNQAAGHSDMENIWKLSEQWMEDQIKPFHVNHLSFSKKYINLVGPTGVGKTTTLAKLAATAVLEHEKKIAFITADTYRIAAIEQLKTYASLLNAPIEVVYTLADFRQALEKFEEYDHIFIDTAGKNYREKLYIEQLKKVIEFEKEMETYLVLALTAKQEDLEDVIENFSVLPIKKFIFTKLDETKSRGSIINLVIKYQKGIAYMTNGQDVPDDLVKANEKTIIKQVFGADRS